MKSKQTILIVYLALLILACVVVPWEASYQGGVRAARGYAPIWSPPRAGPGDPSFYDFTSVDIGRVCIELIGITAIAALVLVVTKNRREVPHE